MNRSFIAALMLLVLPVVVFAADDHVSPLHDAVMNGRLKTVQALLGTPGMDINACDETGWTALHWACSQEEPCSTEQLAILEALLATKGIQVDAQDKLKATPLHYACNGGDFGAVHVLLQAKANPNVQDTSGCSPLHSACFVGDLDMVNALLAAGAQVNVQNTDLSMPLHIACEGGHLGIVKVLLAVPGIDFTSADREGQTPLSLAHKHNRPDVASCLEKFIAMSKGLQKSRIAFLKAALCKEYGVEKLDSQKPLKEQVYFNFPINYDIIKHILSYLSLHACACDEALIETYYHKQDQP